MRITVKPALDPTKDRVFARRVDEFNPNEKGLFAIGGDWIGINQMQMTPPGDQLQTVIIPKIPPGYIGFFLVIIQTDVKDSGETTVFVCKGTNNSTGLTSTFDSIHYAPQLKGEVTFQDIAVNGIFNLFAPDYMFFTTPQTSSIIPVRNDISPAHWKAAWDEQANIYPAEFGRIITENMLTNPSYRAGLFLAVTHIVSVKTPLLAPGKRPESQAEKYNADPLDPNAPLKPAPTKAAPPPPIRLKPGEIPVIFSPNPGTIPKLSGISNAYNMAGKILITLDEKGEPITLVDLMSKLDQMQGDNAMSWGAILDGQADAMAEASALLRIMAQAALLAANTQEQKPHKRLGKNGR